MADEIVVYCIDSDVLIHVGRSYRPDRFPSIWQHLEDLISDARLVSPDEVRAEIQRGNDALVEWVKAHPDMFVDLDEELFNQFRRVESDFPELIDADKLGPHADALIVALALLINSDPGTLLEVRRCVVVTNEKRGGKTKIPSACDHYGVEAIDWFTFMEREDLQF